MRVRLNQRIVAPRLRPVILTLLQAAALLGASEGAKAVTSAIPDPAPTLPAGWLLGTLPGARGGVQLAVLTRPALVPPARYRVVVLPICISGMDGLGC